MASPSKPETAQSPVQVTIALLEAEEPLDAEAVPEGIVSVPLSGKQSDGKCATLLLSDFAHIVQEHGFFLNWIANSDKAPGNPTGRDYVRAYSKRRGDVVQIAWLILDIWPGQGKRVRYLDGNPLNLVRSNLKEEGGASDE